MLWNSLSLNLAFSVLVRFSVVGHSSCIKKEFNEMVSLRTMVCEAIKHQTKHMQVKMHMHICFFGSLCEEVCCSLCWTLYRYYGPWAVRWQNTRNPPWRSPSCPQKLRLNQVLIELRLSINTVNAGSAYVTTLYRHPGKEKVPCASQLSVTTWREIKNRREEHKEMLPAQTHWHDSGPALPRGLRHRPKQSGLRGSQGARVQPPLRSAEQSWRHEAGRRCPPL